MKEWHCRGLAYVCKGTRLFEQAERHEMSPNSGNGTHGSAIYQLGLLRNYIKIYIDVEWTE
jgi:hypothetical protein